VRRKSLADATRQLHLMAIRHARALNEQGDAIETAANLDEACLYFENEGPDEAEGEKETERG
jgi:hypothetical protein